MKKDLLRLYLEYARTEEAFAVLFCKKYLSKSKGHWIDIIDCDNYHLSDDPLHFKYVVCGLYKRRLKPAYPSKSEFYEDGKFNEHLYYQMIRAITWEAAHRDIEQQKNKKVAPTKFKITGVSYDKNRGNKNFFRDDAPTEIKALANNLYDRTNPLWDEALSYCNKPEFVYKICNIRRLDN